MNMFTPRQIPPVRNGRRSSGCDDFPITATTPHPQCRLTICVVAIPHMKWAHCDITAPPSGKFHLPTPYLYPFIFIYSMLGFQPWALSLENHFPSIYIYIWAEVKRWPNFPCPLLKELTKNVFLLAVTSMHKMIPNRLIYQLLSGFSQAMCILTTSVEFSKHLGPK